MHRRVNLETVWQADKANSRPRIANSATYADALFGNGQCFGDTSSFTHLATSPFESEHDHCSALKERTHEVIPFVIMACTDTNTYPIPKRRFYRIHLRLHIGSLRFYISSLIDTFHSPLGPQGLRSGAGQDTSHVFVPRSQLPLLAHHSRG